MLKITENEVILTRGDNADLIVTIKDMSGNVYELQEGDELVFTLKNNCVTQTILIQKDITADSTIHILPEDTSGLNYGKYLFDVQLTTAEDKVYTVIPPTVFVVSNEVNFSA